MCIACIFSQVQFSFWLRVLFSAPLGQPPTPNRSWGLKGYVFQVTSLILERIWMNLLHVLPCYCSKLTLYSHHSAAGSARTKVTSTGRYMHALLLLLLLWELRYVSMDKMNLAQPCEGWRAAWPSLSKDFIFQNRLQGRTCPMLSCYQDWSNNLTLCWFFFFGSNHLSIWYLFYFYFNILAPFFPKTYSHPMACLAGAPWQRSLAGRCL